MVDDRNMVENNLNYEGLLIMVNNLKERSIEVISNL